MWAEGDLGGNESEKIAVIWPHEEKSGRGSLIENTQLASGRTSTTQKTQGVVDERDSGGYEEAGNQ